MAKPIISFRVHPWHYRAIQKQIEEGKRLTEIFEELLNEKFSLSSDFYKF